MKLFAGLERSVFALTLILVSCGGDVSSLNVEPPAASPLPQTAEIAATPVAAPTNAVEAVAVEAEPVEPPAEALPPSDDQALTAGELAAAAEEEDRFSALSAQQAAVARGFQQSEFEAYRQPFELLAKEDSDEPALEAEETALLDELTEELTDDAPPEDVDISAVREQRLQNTQSELPLVLRDEVVRLISYFSGKRGSRTLRTTLGRSGAYREMIERVLEEEDVPPELFHLAQAESGFVPKARSYARATGMWQFMSFRGKQYGLRQDRHIEERYDAEKATRAAAQHLKDLHIEFGDWYLAMAAYNAGPRRVENAIKRGGTRDYWELCAKRLLPRQTRNYVPIILAMTYVSKNLDVYDIGTIDYAPARRYDTVTTDDEITFDLIADLTGSSVTELEDLNPALLRSATPPYSYDLRIPTGSADRFREEIALIPTDKRLQWRRHEVAEGESLAAVAKKYGVSAEQLAELNDLEGESLDEGLRLTVPATTKLRLYRTYGSAGGLHEPGTGRYRIASGDTLGGIARRFGISVSQLRAWNGLSGNLIRAGRYLIVRPDGEGGGSTTSSASADGRYHVRSGDTLGKIAARFGVTVRQLQSWNGLRGTRINVGQSLRVPNLAKASTSSQASAPRQTPPASGRYRIRSGDNLEEIAQRFGVTIGDLRSWNNLRGSRIMAGAYLTVREPGSQASASTSNSGASQSSSTEPVRYRIRSGDNLAVIAQRNGASVADLKRWNGLRSSTIHPGKTLIVGYREASAPSPAPTVASESGASSGATSAAVASNEARYRIRPGDNLGAIAERFGVTAADLRTWNKMRGSRIAAGDFLIVRPPSSTSTRSAAASAPSSSPSPSTSSSPSGGTSYTVRSGDNLSVIADRHGVSVDDLRAWNGLRSTRLSVGQKLAIGPARDSGGQYKIRPGDTLELIAKRFNVTIDQLKAWNNLRSSRIMAGQYIAVRPTSSANLGGG